MTREGHVKTALKLLEEPEKLNIASIHLLYLHDLSKAVDLSLVEVRQSLTATSDHPYEVDSTVVLSPGAIKRYLTNLSVYLQAILRSKDFRPYLTALLEYRKELEDIHRKTEAGMPLRAEDFYKGEDVNLKIDKVVRDVGSFSSYHRVNLRARAQKPQDPDKVEEAEDG